VDFKGCSVLVILRAAECAVGEEVAKQEMEEYKLIGEAFVEGMMDGQVILPLSEISRHLKLSQFVK
jgi:hypothetical protein